MEKFLQTLRKALGSSLNGNFCIHSDAEKTLVTFFLGMDYARDFGGMYIPENLGSCPDFRVYSDAEETEEGPVAFVCVEYFFRNEDVPEKVRSLEGDFEYSFKENELIILPVSEPTL